ncbi:MAG TPA: serine/threonine-protein kinase, partial [Candidatus Nanopelagicales bacterium]|nr:serine/threonine-protein kinase [Candidatus Nanopelagicales bacterium]
MSAPGLSIPDGHIGKYRVIAELGRGGMARVLLTVAAGPAGFEKLLVVKKLRDELAEDGEFLTMFLDEARIAARLNHPNVVHTYEVGTEDGVYYIAMDYLEGQPLSAILRKIGRAEMPLEVHVRVLADMLAGLDYAHHLADFDGTPLSVVHRDVSPQNVFVTYDGQVKLVDFGIAKAAVASNRTKEGVFKGKAAYIAPEQARAERVDGRADIFSAGVMLFEAIAGRRFAQGHSEVGAIMARVQGLEPRVHDVAPDAPAELVRICDRALAVDRADRYERAAEMREELEAWLESRPTRAGQREVAALVSQAFAEERAALRVRVDEQLKRLRAGERASVLQLQPGTVGPATDGTPSRDSEVMVQSAQSTVKLPAAAPRPSPRAWLPWVALIGVAAIGGAALLLGQPAAPGADPAGAQGTPPAPSPSGVDITLRFTPPHATVILDGARVEGNPFRGRFPRDGSAHQLEVRADGFRADRRVLAFDRDHDITIDLPRDGAPGSAPADSTEPAPAAPADSTEPAPAAPA